MEWRVSNKWKGEIEIRVVAGGGGRRKKWKSARWRVNDNESDGFMQSPERRNCTNRLGGVNRQTHWPTEPSGRRRHNYRHTHAHTHNVHRENQSLRILRKNVKTNQHLYNCWLHVTHLLRYETLLAQIHVLYYTKSIIHFKKISI